MQKCRNYAGGTGEGWPARQSVADDFGKRLLVDAHGACSSDHATLLKCDPARGRFVVWNLCTGPQHSVVDSISGTSLPVCDRSEASLGGPCAKGDENARSCSADFRDVLLCKSGTYKRGTTCPPSKRCFNAGHGDLDAMCTQGIP